MTSNRYEIDPAAPWLSELTEAQRAVLEPPYGAGPRPLVERDGVSAPLGEHTDSLMMGYRPRHKDKVDAGKETDAPMARAAKL